jgi:hypothetical protein
LRLQLKVWSIMRVEMTAVETPRLLTDLLSLINFTMSRPSVTHISTQQTRLSIYQEICSQEFKFLIATSLKRENIKFLTLKHENYFRGEKGDAFNRRNPLTRVFFNLTEAGWLNIRTLSTSILDSLNVKKVKLTL